MDATFKAPELQDAVNIDMNYVYIYIYIRIHMSNKYIYIYIYYGCTYPCVQNMHISLSLLSRLNHKTHYPFCRPGLCELTITKLKFNLQLRAAKLQVGSWQLLGWQLVAGVTMLAAGSTPDRGFSSRADSFCAVRGEALGLLRGGAAWRFG